MTDFKHNFGLNDLELDGNSEQCGQKNLPSLPLPLFSSKQIYEFESQWFAAGHDDFALMQQAAWQGAHWINRHIVIQPYKHKLDKQTLANKQAMIWVGSGNNGGDGWLMAHYLAQFGWQVQVVEVAPPKSKLAKKAHAQFCKYDEQQTQSAIIALEDNITVEALLANPSIVSALFRAGQLPIVHIDALFGIGLDRVPEGNYRSAIEAINTLTQLSGAQYARSQVVAVDIPSGLVASTGQVFESIGVHADYTLCMLARKVGLHIKSGLDYAGQIIDLPLIPYDQACQPCAWLYDAPQPLIPRNQDSHKGSYGYILIIGGNCVEGSQGMGGAAILSGSAAMAAGLGKLTVACHSQFHGALISNLPNAMSVDLQHKEAVTDLISQADVVAIGMGLGRDEKSEALFCSYLNAAIDANKDMVIDADGLYHLASLRDNKNKKNSKNKKSNLSKKLKEHTKTASVYFTPHSGEAARLLDCEVTEVEADRISAVQKLQQRFGGSWLLKGAGSIISTQSGCHVCAAGNAGMATAGMGDVLSGLAASLLAQSDLPKSQRSLLQAVLVHAQAGDKLATSVGERGVQAKDMANYIAQVIEGKSNK